MRRSRRIALTMALAMVAAACGGGSDASPATMAPPMDSGELAAAAVAPEFLTVDQDPASPISMTVGFAPNDQGILSLVILGDKLPSTRSPDEMLIYIEGRPEPFDLTFDTEGRPRHIIAPDGAELRVLSYQGSQATVAAIDPDGTTEVVTVAVPEVDLSAFDALDASAAPTGVNAVPASYRAAGGVPPLATVVVTTAGSYSTRLPDGLNPSDVLLRAGRCTVPEIGNVPGTSRGTYLTCTASIGADEVVVRSTVDVPALYGGEVPPIFFETEDACGSAGMASKAAGGLLIAGALASVVVTGLAVVTVASLEAILAVMSVGSVPLFAGSAMGSALIYVGSRPCTGAFTTNEGLAGDVAERLLAVSATVDLTPIVLQDPASYTATAEPARLVFAPFGSDRLDPITVTVVPVAEPGGGDAGDGGSTGGGAGIDGTYTGTVTRYPEDNLLEVVGSTVSVTVDGSSIFGTERFEALRSGDYGASVVVVLAATQWVEFSGHIEPDGSFSVPGLSFSSWEVRSCDGSASNCDNVFPPTGTPDGYPVTVVGNIESGMMSAEIVWPDRDEGTYAFVATRPE